MQKNDVASNDTKLGQARYFLAHWWSPNPTHDPYSSMKAEHRNAAQRVRKHQPLTTEPRQLRLALWVQVTVYLQGSSSSTWVHLPCTAASHRGVCARPQTRPRTPAHTHAHARARSPRGNRDPFADTNSCQNTHYPPGRAAFTDLTGNHNFGRYKSTLQPFMMVFFSFPRVTTRNFLFKILGISFK